MSVDPPAEDSTPLSAQFRTGTSSSMPTTPLQQPPPFQRSPPSLIHTTDVPLMPTPPAQPAASSSHASSPPPQPATSAEKDKGKTGEDAAPQEQDAAGLVTWDDAIGDPHDEYRNKLPRTHTRLNRDNIRFCPMQMFKQNRWPNATFFVRCMI